MSEWQHGICGCFDNCCICMASYFVPCYVHGKTAEAVGDSCVMCGLALLIPGVGFIFIATTRQKVRDQKGIAGSFLEDVVASYCCPCCVVAQSGQEVNALGDEHAQAMAIARV